MYRSSLVFVLLGLMLLVLGCVRAFHHEPWMAAAEAQKFADVTFVAGEPEKAYGFLSDRMKKGYSLDAFKSDLKNAHPNGYPTRVSAMEYEPIPGQAAMSIYLLGQNEKENFYYRLTMEGTADKGYQVGGVWRSIDPLPGSSLRQPLTSSPSNNNSQ